MEVTRGAVVVVAARGAYTGKPRPAVVVQSDAVSPTFESVTVCPITSALVDDAAAFRVMLASGRRTGLRVPSQVMVDKVGSVPRARISSEIGECSEREMAAIDEAIRGWLGLD